MSATTTDTTDRAIAFLEREGMRLLARNLKIGRTNVPLVMADGPTVVFVMLSAENSIFDACRALEAAKTQRSFPVAVFRYLADRPWVPSVRVDLMNVTDGAVAHMRGFASYEVPAAPHA